MFCGSLTAMRIAEVIGTVTLSLSPQCHRFSLGDRGAVQPERH